jgi:arylsulfatase A-like enzyme
MIMAEKRNPNVVFVLTDDQGYGDLGCHGNEILKTPHIDQLHAQSVRFTNFHVGPTCAPTRSSLFTGHYANSTGVWHTVGGRSLLRKDEVTLPAVLRENGYRTGLFGKWHLGDNYPYRPQDRGFETVVMHGGGGISQITDYWGNDYFDDTYSVNGIPKTFKGYCTDVFFGEAFDFINAHAAEPFFCCITTNAPHSPYNVAKKYRDLYTDVVPKDGHEDDRARFYGMITNIDENIGRLYDLLERKDLLEDTVLVFMTDNGTSCGGSGAHTCGLRGHKGSEYDGGHRVPFFVRFPQGTRSPCDVNTLTANIDFMPTILELCGLDPCAYTHCNFHGKSLVPLLSDPAPEWPERCLVTDSQRLVNPVKWRKSAVMTERWRLVNGTRLYDINRDRGQEKDISRDHPGVVEELRKNYEHWWKTVSVKFDQEIPVSIGSENEKRVRLTSHDWRHLQNPWGGPPDQPEDNSHLVFHQRQVRQGGGGIGYHEIQVETAGRYRFELKRWPEEENRRIQDGIPESEHDFRAEDIQNKNHYFYKGGVSMCFETAFLEITKVSGNCGREGPIAGQQVCASRAGITAADTAVTFSAELSKGPHHLKSWFEGKDGLFRGAYYVYVSREPTAAASKVLS